MIKKLFLALVALAGQASAYEYLRYQNPVSSASIVTLDHEGSLQLSGPVTIDNLTASRCVETGAGGLLTVTSGPCSTASGGASTLAVADGDVNITSPTTRIQFDGSQFIVTNPVGSTATITIDASSVTVLGNRIDLGNILEVEGTLYHKVHLATGTVGELNYQVSLATGVTGTLYHKVHLATGTVGGLGFQVSLATGVTGTLYHLVAIGTGTIFEENYVLGTATTGIVVGGDLTGTVGNAAVTDDSHNHSAITMTGVIKDTATLQTGAMFSVSSGNVSGKLSATSLAVSSPNPVSVVSIQGDLKVGTTAEIQGGGVSMQETVFQVGAATFSVRADGAVIIGGLASGAGLTISTNATTGEVLRIQSVSATGNPFIGIAQAGTRRSFLQYVDSGDVLRFAAEFGDMQFMTGRANGSEEIVLVVSDLDAGGNVGIMDTSPDALLEVKSSQTPTGYVVAFSSQNDVTANLYGLRGDGKHAFNNADANLAYGVTVGTGMVVQGSITITGDTLTGNTTAFQVIGSTFTALRDGRILVSTTTSPPDLTVNMGGTRGFRFPVVTPTQRDAITSTGAMVFVSTVNKPFVLTDSNAWAPMAGLPPGFYGDGSDGVFTASGTTTLSRTMFYSSVTVNSGAVIDLAGWQLFVSGKLTNSGFITSTGTAGGNASGATAGTAGAGATQNDMGGGGAGRAGGTGGTAPAGSGGAGTQGVNVVGQGSAGGAGGAGETADGNGGVTGSTSTVTYRPKRAIQAFFFTSALSTILQGGAGGSSAGGGGAQGLDNGGGGGGSGGGGGAAFIAARQFINNGTVSVAGEKGGNGATAGGTAGDGGGGGGGGGGWTMLISESTIGGTFTAAGGLGGARGGGGVAGSPGTDGIVMKYHALRGEFY